MMVTLGATHGGHSWLVVYLHGGNFNDITALQNFCKLKFVHKYRSCRFAEVVSSDAINRRFSWTSHTFAEISRSALSWTNDTIPIGSSR